MRGLIKHILKEETNNFELVKNFIYTMFDNVRVVEYVAERNEIMVYYKGKPFLRPTEICDTIKDYTGLNVFPYYEYNKNNVGIWDPDFYLDVEEYDEELNENYSPAGKEIIPNKILVHVSNSKVRDKIMEQGLRVRAGECYKIYAGYGEKCVPAIFATNSTNKRAWFDSTYDDDVWEIDTTMIPDVKWYKDRHYDSRSKHIVTFQDIPKEAITLKHEGTGKDWGYISENIKEHPREEEFNRYKEDIDRIVYSVVSKEEICGYGTEFFLNGGEDALRIVLYYNGDYHGYEKHYINGGYPGYEKHMEYAKDIKFMIENYLPIVEMTFVSYDSTKCKGSVTENVDEVEKNLKVIRMLLKQVNWEGLCDVWVEYNPIDKDYEIRSKSTIRPYDHDEIIKDLDYIDNALRSMGLSVYIYTPWYVDSCEDEVKFLNEQKEETNYLGILKDIVEPFKKDDGVCDIDMWYDDEDDMYSVYLIFGTEELNNKFTNDGKYLYIRKKIIAVKEAIKSYLPIDNLFVGSYGKPNCGWKSLNESKEKSTKELITTVLNTIVLPDYEHVICGFEVKEPHERFDTSGNARFQFMSVTIIFIGGLGTKLWPQTQGVQRMYDDVTDEVWDVIYNYTNEAVDVYYKTVKDCGKENIYLREQKEEPKYLSLIKELVEPFKDEEGVCDIDVSYDDEDDMYSVYIVIGTEEMNEKFFYVPAMNSHISKLRMNVKNTIKQYIPIDNLYVGSYGKPNCEWDPISK